ncbi:unnamed protein product, partial [Closterium sp. NIES-53]
TGRTALHEAVVAGSLDAAALLLEWGADPDGGTAAAEGGQSPPLMSAVQAGSEEAVRLLLTNGADINATDARLCSALHYACATGHRSIIKLLLVAGANMYARNRDGLLPQELTSSDRIGALFRKLHDYHQRCAAPDSASPAAAPLDAATRAGALGGFRQGGGFEDGDLLSGELGGSDLLGGSGGGLEDIGGFRPELGRSGSGRRLGLGLGVEGEEDGGIGGEFEGIAGGGGRSQRGAAWLAELRARTGFDAGDGGRDGGGNRELLRCASSNSGSQGFGHSNSLNQNQSERPQAPHQRHSQQQGYGGGSGNGREGRGEGAEWLGGEGLESKEELFQKAWEHDRDDDTTSPTFPISLAPTSVGRAGGEQHGSGQERGGVRGVGGGRRGEDGREACDSSSETDGSGERRRRVGVRRAGGLGGAAATGQAGGGATAGAGAAGARGQTQGQGQGQAQAQGGQQAQGQAQGQGGAAHMVSQPQLRYHRTLSDSGHRPSPSPTSLSPLLASSPSHSSPNATSPAGGSDCHSDADGPNSQVRRSRTASPALGNAAGRSVGGRGGGAMDGRGGRGGRAGVGLMGRGVRAGRHARSQSVSLDGSHRGGIPLGPQGAGQSRAGAEARRAAAGGPAGRRDGAVGAGTGAGAGGAPSNDSVGAGADDGVGLDAVERGSGERGSKLENFRLDAQYGSETEGRRAPDARPLLRVGSLGERHIESMRAVAAEGVGVGLDREHGRQQQQQQQQQQQHVRDLRLTGALGSDKGRERGGARERGADGGGEVSTSDTEVARGDSDGRREGGDGGEEGSAAVRAG